MIFTMLNFKQNDFEYIIDICIVHPDNVDYVDNVEKFIKIRKNEWINKSNISKYFLY